MKFESNKGPKKEKQKHILSVGKLTFVLIIISLLLFLCTPKLISKVWCNSPIPFKITQNETHTMKI
jgi:hypothetical protein